MQIQNAKAAPDANRSSFQNQFDAAGIQKDFRVYYERKLENFQDGLTAVLTTRPRKIIRCVPCGICKRAFAPVKMSEFPKVCRGCLESAQTKPIRERRRFIDLALNNYHKILRGALAI